MKVYIRGVNKYLKHNVNRVTKKMSGNWAKSWAELLSALCTVSHRYYGNTLEAAVFFHGLSLLSKNTVESLLV